MMDLEPPDYAINGLIPLGGRTLLFAQAGHPKTNLLVDMLCHVAHGLDWHGLAVKQHPVIIVATEDPKGTSTRIAGWHVHHGMPGGRVIVVPGGEFRLIPTALIVDSFGPLTAGDRGEAVGRSH